MSTTTTDPILTLRTTAGGEWTLRASRVQQTYLPTHQHLWVIGCTHGASGAVWAKSEDEAFDVLADEGWAGAFVVDEDAKEGNRFTHIGNHGEAVDLSEAWIERVKMAPDADRALWRHATSAEAEDAEHCVEVTLKVLIYPSRLPSAQPDRAWLEEHAIEAMRLSRTDPARQGDCVVSWRVIDSHEE